MELFMKADLVKQKCDSCNSNTLSKKHLRVQGAPPVLVIHLKRFKVTLYQTTKMQNMITFPLYDFDLSDYVAFKEPDKCY
jgi:ubiquitin carboxyl-terminal hydrolase 4/11/15